MPATVSAEPASPVWYRRLVPGWFALLVACTFLGAFGYKIRFDGVFACPGGGYGANAFLSDCTAGAYGDYDHGAFWLGLEPQAQRAASAADILIVGNSRLQFAFSGAGSAGWFSSRGIRYYLLGFSHSETVVFLEPLLSKIRPHAKVYVVNVDRFFVDRVSPPMQQILQDRDSSARYEEKRAWQSVHRVLCGALPAACGSAVAVYRERGTGAWRRLGSGHSESRQVAEGSATNLESWEHYATLAQRFVARLPVDRACVILTIVPSSETRRAEAMAIAAKLGHDLVSPRLEGLLTFDGSHLDEASAERWSEAFFEEAGPQIKRCIAAAPSKG
jgi:hypothetical protein